MARPAGSAARRAGPSAPPPQPDERDPRPLLQDRRASARTTPRRSAAKSRPTRTCAARCAPAPAACSPRRRRRRRTGVGRVPDHAGRRSADRHLGDAVGSGVDEIVVRPVGLRAQTMYEVRSIDTGLLGDRLRAELMADGVAVVGLAAQRRARPRLFSARRLTSLIPGASPLGPLRSRSPLSAARSDSRGSLASSLASWLGPLTRGQLWAGLPRARQSSARSAIL